MVYKQLDIFISEARIYMRIDKPHFAFDDYKQKNIIMPKMQMVREITGWNRNKCRPAVFILCNYDTTIEQDIERIQFCRTLGWTPYVMIYNKGDFFTDKGRLRSKQELLRRYSQEQIDHAVVCQKLQRWCNNYIFWKCKNFEDYQKVGD